jgi:heme A synthase
LVGSFLVVISGSIVVNAGAQSACTSWPAGFSSPATMGLVVIQLVHRSMVLVGSLLVVAFLVSVWRKKGTDPVERNLSLCAIALLAAQIVVGALSALYSSHSEFADVHLALASALWGPSSRSSLCRRGNDRSESRIHCWAITFRVIRRCLTY